MKIGDKINIDSSELAIPSADDFWSMVLKYVSFDEPSSRCARLKKALAKQFKPAQLKEFDINTISQLEQDWLFDAVFGARPNTPLDRVLSVLIALEEIARFDEIAFDSWANETSSKSAISDSLNEPPFVSNDALEQKFWMSLRDWLEHANLSSGQIRWITHCAIATPAWSVLSQNESLNENSLATFLTRARAQLSVLAADRGLLSAKDFSLAHAQFIKLLNEFRAELSGEFLPNAIVIVEGQTEEILLPRFARALGMNLSHDGVMIVSAGGAKQVARRYLFLRDLVSLPIVCILDRDADEQASVIADTIRDCDKLFVLQAGEIEDTFSPDVFAKFINDYLETMPGSVQKVVANDFPSGTSRKVVLNRLWKSRKLGDFDKVAFAESLAASLDTADDVPTEISQVLKFLAEVAAENV